MDKNYIQQNQKPAGPAYYLANERTFLDGYALASL